MVSNLADTSRLHAHLSHRNYVEGAHVRRKRRGVRSSESAAQLVVLGVVQQPLTPPALPAQRGADRLMQSAERCATM